MDRCPPSVVARRERALPLDQPTGPFPDTLTEAVLTRQGPRMAPGPEGTGMNEGAAAEGEKRPVPTPLEILDGVHARIRIDAEELRPAPGVAAPGRYTGPLSEIV
jgi:hypothetical protein